MSVRERVQVLVEEMPDADLLVAERMLRGLKLTRDEQADPLLAFLESCPEDDEPYTEVEQQADVEAWARYRRGQWVSHEEVVRRPYAGPRGAAYDD